MDQTDVRVSLASAGLPGRYVAALFELADEGQLVDRVARDMQALEQALAATPELRALVEDRSIGRADAGAAIAAVAAALSVDDLTRRFLGVLAENGRLGLLPAVVAQFARQLDFRRGILRAHATSAQPLAPEQLDALRAKLAARTGLHVEVETAIDPELLGGLVVRIGSEQIDSSIRTRLDRLGQQLKG